MVLKFCLPAIDHALGTASRLAVSGSQGTRRRSLPRRAARRYIAIPGAPRGRHSRPPRFLHIRGPRGGRVRHGGASPPCHVHGGQSHREPGVGVRWESARMGTGARAPRAIGTEHAGTSTGRDRAPGGPSGRTGPLGPGRAMASPPRRAGRDPRSTPGRQWRRRGAGI